MNHDLIERKTGLMVALIILVISLGGLVEILPLFSSESTTTPVAGLPARLSPGGRAGERQRAVVETAQGDSGR